MLIKLKDASKQLNICEASLRRFIKEGRIRGYQFGPKTVRINLAEAMAAATAQQDER